MSLNLKSSGGGSVTVDVPSTASNYTATLPAANTTVVGTDATQTLTNKTITSPTITGAVVSSMASSVITSGTSVSASGTSVNFTDIPSWVKRITVMFQGVSLSGTAGFLIQIGSGSLTTTGYVSGGLTAQSSSSSSGGFTNTTGFQTNDASAAAYIYNGNIILNNVSGNLWMESGLLSATSGARGGISGGSITLSGALDRVRINTTNGTDTFDAGSINILYE